MLEAWVGPANVGENRDNIPCWWEQIGREQPQAFPILIGKWAIIHNETQEFMGRAGFVLLDQTNEIDLGYAFHKKFWNQGYASELAQVMVDHAINRWPRERIVELILQGNNASIKVLEKVGFRYSRSHEYFGLPFKVYAL